MSDTVYHPAPEPARFAHVSHGVRERAVVPGVADAVAVRVRDAPLPREVIPEVEQILPVVPAVQSADTINNNAAHKQVVMRLSRLGSMHVGVRDGV